MQFEQEKFSALQEQVNNLHDEMMAAEDYFEFKKLEAIRDELVKQLESCVAIVNGKQVSIKEYLQQRAA